MCAREVTPRFFNISILLFSILFRAHFCPGVSPGVPTRVDITPFLTKTLFSSMFTRCLRLQKKVCTSIHISVFRHFNPAFLYFTPKALFIQVITSGSYTDIRKSFLSNHFIFFRIHTLSEVIKRYIQVQPPRLFEILKLKCAVLFRVHFCLMCTS